MLFIYEEAHMEDLSFFCGAVDNDLYMQYADRACKAFLGNRADKQITDIMMEFDADFFKDACERVLISGFEEDMLISLERPDGVFSPFHINLSLSEDSGVRSVQFRASDVYLSEERSREFKSRLFEYEDFVTGMGFFLFKYNRDSGNISFFSYENNEKKILFDNLLSAWVDVQIEQFVPEDDKAKVASFQSILESSVENCSVTFHTSFFSDDETTKLMQFSGTNVISQGGERFINGFVMNVKEDSKTPVISAMASSDKDQATGVYDKEAIKAYTIKTLSEMKDDEWVWIAIFDIDEFKEVNDNYGRSFGDEVIRALSKCILRAVGSSGAVGRFGGDQFFMCVSGMEENDIRGLFTEVKKNFEWEVRSIQSDSHLTLTIGTVSAPLNGTDYDVLFEKLWKALYIGKAKGRNRYIIYREEMHASFELPKADSAAKNMKGQTQLLAVMISDVTEGIIGLGRGAVTPALKELSDVMLLDGIRIFSGPGLPCVYSTAEDGNDAMPEEVAEGIMNSYSFDQNGIMMIDRVEFCQEKDPLIYEWANERRIGAVAFYLEKGREGKPERVFSFEHVLKSNNRRWGAEDANYLLIFSKLIALALREYYADGEAI